MAMVATGSVATAVTFLRRDPAPVWIAIGYFAIMEILQVAGYAVIDDCGSTTNKTVTLASYLHIAFQPIVINLFALQLVPARIREKALWWVLSIAALSSAVMLIQLAPVAAFGQCAAGTALCGDAFCTRSGEWHIAWDVPYNGLLLPIDTALGTAVGFPSYMLAVFFMPMIYGAWRFVLLHVLLGPVLASGLTNDPGEMPAIWCLFSVAILLIALCPPLRRSVSARSWWGLRA